LQAISAKTQMERIVGIEISHRNAPIAIREQLALNKNQISKALNDLKKHYKEVFIISTCNRLSIYAYGDNYLYLEKHLEQYGNYGQYITVLPDSKIAVQNLFSTSAGLESQAIGEHQIVGQIRDSFELSKKSNTIGPILDELIRNAIHIGKRARLETNIGKHSASLATVGFELINKHNYNLEECSILVIGTGNMANLVNTIIDRSQLKELYIASHDLARAKVMANDWNGKAIHVSELHQLIRKVDIIIGGTQGEINLLSEKSIGESKCTRAQFGANIDKPKLLIDFGLPRNFNPELKSFENVFLYDLDDIKRMTYEGLLKRYEEIPQVKEIVDEEVNRYTQWLYQRKTSPIIEAYWNNLLNTKEDELKWLLPKLGEISSEQQKLIERFAHRLIRKVSKKPLEEVQNFAQNLHHRDNPINTVKKVFNLDDVELFVPQRRIVIGTRGSKLALTQTHQIIEKLRQIEPQNEYVTKVIRTEGDNGNINVLGAFTSAIQSALYKGQIDLAVHSYKDLPTEENPYTKIAAVSKREDIRDVLISKNGEKLSELKKGAIVGTGSLRREVQIKRLRPDLEVKFIQGNVDSRIKQMKSGEYDSIILAAAGLIRLGIIDQADEILSEDQMIPAVSQGALAIEIRKSDHENENLLSKINDGDTEVSTIAERRFLNALGGGCNSPIAAHARVDGSALKIKGLYASADGGKIEIDGIEGHKKLATQLAEQLARNLHQKIHSNTNIPTS